MPGKHHGHQHHGKPEFVSHKAKAREGVCRKGTGDGVNHRTRDTNDEGIDKERTELDNADSLPASNVVLYRPCFWQKAWIAEYLGAFFERRHEKPDNRIKHRETDNNDKDMGK
jgi:hypothetical protein